MAQEDVNIPALEEAAASSAADLIEVYQPGQTEGTRNRRLSQGRLWRRVPTNRSGGHTLTAADEALSQRFTHSGNQVLTLPGAAAGISSGVYAEGAEYRCRKLGTGELSLDLTAGGVTVNPPKGGQPVAQPGDAFILVIAEVGESSVSIDWVGGSKDA